MASAPRPMISGLLLLTLAAAPIAAQYTPPADPTPLQTTFVAWDSLVAKHTSGGESRAVFDNPTLALDKFEMHVTTLLPGKSSHPVHQHPWEEMLYIKEGTLDLSINGQIQQAGPGSLVFLASHDPHNGTNRGAVPATYYVINFVTDRVHSVADRPALEQAVPGSQGSAIIDCDHAATTPTDTGSRANILDRPTLTFKRFVIHITTLNEGQHTKPAMLDDGNELFIVRSGSLEATVNGISCRLREGSFFYCAPNDRRALRNVGKGPASYLVLKVVSDRS